MEMKISDELNLIVRYAREEAMRTGSYGIGTDHLVLGILRHADNNACRALRGLGADPEHVKVITPLPNKHEENVATIKAELAYKGLSVIVSRRECIQTLRRKK